MTKVRVRDVYYFTALNVRHLYGTIEAKATALLGRVCDGA